MDRKVKGFTLIELLVILSIIAIVLSIAIPQFTKWKKKYDVQYDIKNIYTLIQDARMKSFVEKKVCGLYWGTTSEFKKIYERCDTDYDGEINDSGGYVDITILNLKSKFKSSNSTYTYIKFSRGVVVNFDSIYLTDLNEEEVNNCVAVSVTRAKIGSWNGTDCN